MSSSVLIEIVDRSGLVKSFPLSDQVQIGRQFEDEPEPYALVDTAHGRRLIIARWEDVTAISRRHAALEVLPDRQVRIANLSGKIDLKLVAHAPIRPGESRRFDLPVGMRFGDLQVRITDPTPPPQQEQGVLEHLADMTLPPTVGGTHFGLSLTNLTAKPPREAGGNTEELASWLRGLIDVFQCAASAPDFLQSAAQITCDMVQLDSAGVLRFEDNAWTVACLCAHRGQSPARGWQPSATMLERVRRDKRTFWLKPQADEETPQSLTDVKALVVAPILDADAEVIGALYGERRLGGAAGGTAEISRAEAMLVELLSCSVAAGLARVTHEQAAMAARVRFEQFFSPELARELEEHPDLLSGRDTEITALFCDIRGFSGFTEQLGPARTLEWLNEVLGQLSQCVIDHQGVLVDYVGDELMAIWGAPVPRAEHAQLACRAALAMAARLPELNQRWQPLLGRPMDIGVGLCTGAARVGNVGSHLKFKYGALGNTVNLASRVQGATKQLGARILVTGDTATRLGDAFATRRLCRVQLVGLSQPVDLHELHARGDAGWDDLAARYGDALAAFEAGRFHEATQILGNLSSTHPDDRPTLRLLSRAVSELAEPGEAFDPVWRLTKK